MNFYNFPREQHGRILKIHGLFLEKKINNNPDSDLAG